MKYILALTLGLMSATANAKLVTFDFSGVLNAPVRHLSNGSSTTEPIFMGLIKEGDSFSGQFTYDTAAKVTGGYLTTTYYELYSFNLQASSVFNSSVTSWPGTGFTVDHFLSGNPEKVDHFWAGGGNEEAVGTDNWISAIVDAKVPGRTFNRPELPDSLGGFIDSKLTMRLYHGNYWAYDEVVSDVHIQMAAVSPVPEPSSALTMLAALAGIGGMAALRRRS